jgi:hypothetical protein
LWVLLTLGILAVTLGLSLSGRAKVTRWVRVWGGPTEGPTPLSLRLELVDTEANRARRSSQSALLVVSDGQGNRSESAFTFDDQGTAFLQLPQRSQRTIVTVTIGGERLASGPINLSRYDYWTQRKVRGGWLRGKTDGRLSIAVGCRSGVLAQGQPGELAILVATPSGQPATTALTVELEGLETAPPNSPISIRSNDQGRATIAVVARDLSASIRVLAGNRDTPTASYFSSVPIERTTLEAGIRNGSIVAKSLIPLAKAYYSLVNDQGRWAAGAIDLLCDAAGHCHGEVSVQSHPTLPAWVMLGTEPALDGPNVVGWPVVATAESFVAESITVKDQLLLDGRSELAAEAARENGARFSRVVTGMVIAVLILLLAVALPIVRARRQNRALVSQWPEAERATAAEHKPIGLVGLLVVMLLGLLALAYWAKIRILGN